MLSFYLFKYKKNLSNINVIYLKKTQEINKLIN